MAIIGVGNCASSLVQGVHYYQEAREDEFIPGLMVIAADGTVAYRRAWTDLPAGERVASFWSRQVRRALDELTVRGPAAVPTSAQTLNR